MRVPQIPPSCLNLFILLAVALHYIMPIKQLISKPYSYGGVILIIAGLTLNIWSGSLLRGSKTPIAFYASPRELVTDGPFHLSRNPIYLSGLILISGVAITLGSLITFFLPPALFLILNQVYIPKEEIVLEEIFGDRYLAYKKRVRRWL